MKYLLDTHIFLWWLLDAKKLSTKINNIIKDAENELYFSAISSWEICIKIQLNKLSLPDNPIYYIPKKIKEHNILELDVNHNHVLHLLLVPLIHRDLFDRVLVAQTMSEDMILLSCDEILKKYPIPVIS